MTMPHAAITTELILGGQKSGKSRRAECNFVEYNSFYRVFFDF